MVTQEDINTVLGAACYNLGYPVINAALYRDIVPPEITDEQLKAECEKIKAEQDIFSSGQATLTIQQLTEQIAYLQTQLAKLST